MSVFSFTAKQISDLLINAAKLELATQNYPSRGQTTTQELYQTARGKLFLKRVSKRNHSDCQIAIEKGTLAEREYWAFLLARELGLRVPQLCILDEMTTVQSWFDIPDGRTYTTSQAAMKLKTPNVFDCAAFDWLTGQVDRHDANYLYDYVKEEIVLIDSAHSFLKYDGSLPDYLKIFEIAYPNEIRKRQNTAVKSKIMKLNFTKIQSIVPLKDPEEKSMLETRLDQIGRANTLHDIINLYRG
jgi:hypothetical protein